MRCEWMLYLLLAAPLFANENDGGLVDTEEFLSPDKRALVLVQSLNIVEHRSDGVFSTPSRVVSLVDIHSLKCVFAFKTYERFTRAFWNPSGSRCLIMDCPDDGNTFLYLLSKAGADWNELSLIDVCTAD